MDKEKVRMNQSSEVIALTRGVNRFFASLPMLGDPYDGRRMELISKSAACRIAHLEDMRKARLDPWHTEQYCLRIETYVKSRVFDVLKTNRIVKARRASARAVYRGEQTEISEVDERRIEREAARELSNLWCEIIWD